MMLRSPTHADEAAIRVAHQLTRQSDPNFFRPSLDGITYARWLDAVADKARGIGLAPDEVPSSFYIATVGDAVVGRLTLRHELNAFVRDVAGHIGYVVVPQFRRRGYATAILRQALALARARGIGRALLTCDVRNDVSRKIIETCGGVFENVYRSPDGSVEKRRYWIATGPA